MWLIVARLAGCRSENAIVADLPYASVTPAPTVPGVERTDRIVQVTVPKVDVLWTIDTSSSMGDELAFIESLPSFAAYFVNSELDYHLGVLTTDLADPAHDGSLQMARGYRYIDSETPDPIEVFTEMVRFDVTAVGDDGEECGLGAVFRALGPKRDTVNAGFLREDADLHAIVVSDEEDQTPAHVVTVPAFVAWYEGLAGDDREQTFSSVVEQGARYLEVTDAIGGVRADIGQGDWSTLLDGLGLWTGGYRTEFFLSHLPVPDSVEVLEERTNGVKIPHDPAVFDEDGELIGGTWTWTGSRNSVLFVGGYVPEPGAVIAITYIQSE